PGIERGNQLRTSGRGPGRGDRRSTRPRRSPSAPAKSRPFGGHSVRRTHAISDDMEGRRFGGDPRRRDAGRFGPSLCGHPDPLVGQSSSPCGRPLGGPRRGGHGGERILYRSTGWLRGAGAPTHGRFRGVPGLATFSGDTEKSTASVTFATVNCTTGDSGGLGPKLSRQRSNAGEKAGRYARGNGKRRRGGCLQHRDSRQKIWTVRDDDPDVGRPIRCGGPGEG